ncbi:MAG TPA: hypothetical protein VGI95_10610 [Caulobacteraceae bacterium]|jgi:hypothetical protein
MLVVFAATAVSVRPTSAMGADASVFARVGATAADVERDEGECRTLAAKTYYVMPQARQGRDSSFQSPSYQLVGSVIVAALTPGYNAQAQSRSLATCMRHRGYGQVRLSAEEARSFGAAQADAARQVWLNTFLSGDIAHRVATALIPAAPPLPQASDAHDTFVVGAVRIDPQSLALADGPIAANQAVLTGTARLRRTAVLDENYRDSIALSSFQADAGTVFQEYQDRTPWDDPNLDDGRTAWCAVFKLSNHVVCVRSTMEGYELPPAEGTPWLVGSVGVENMYTRPLLHPMKLTLQPEGSDWPLGLRLVATRITDSQVSLSATAKTASATQAVEIWRGNGVFDAEGQVKLPFWDRTLVLTHVGHALTASFEPRSDGKGWLDGAPALAQHG